MGLVSFFSVLPLSPSCTHTFESPLCLGDIILPQPVEKLMQVAFVSGRRAVRWFEA